MCEYANVENGQCNVTKQICPYLYFCNKILKYKPNSSMPSDCKIKQNLEVPKGYYKVCFERRGRLYIEVDGFVKIVPNPFDETPIYVKIIKQKNGTIKLKKYEG